MNYRPSGHSRRKDAECVRLVEAEPPEHLRSIVHRFIHVQSEGRLASDYRFHALPDACTYLVFDQTRVDVAGATRLSHTAQALDLGRSFHFVNVRLLPGVWQLHRCAIATGQIKTPYAGDLPLVAINRRLKGRDFAEQIRVLSELVEWLVGRGVLATSTVLHRLLCHVDDLNCVADMAAVVGVSPRHLQRLLNRSVGFSPHDLLKVLKIQRSLRHGPGASYADQSHFIHAFRKATGYTPGAYAKAFDV